MQKRPESESQLTFGFMLPRIMEIPEEKEQELMDALADLLLAVANDYLNSRGGEIEPETDK